MKLRNQIDRMHTISQRILWHSLAITRIVAVFPTVTLATDGGDGLIVEEGLIQDAFGKDFMNRPGLIGDDWGVSKQLKTWGIVPFATLTGEFLANTGGGFDNGSIWGGLIDFGVEVDFEPGLGWNGGSLFVNAFAFRGNNPSVDVGDYNAISNIYTDTELNIFNIYLKQSFQDGKVWFKAGQIAADDDFMASDTALLFVNSAFGPIPTESGNIAAPIYPLAAPGAFAYVEPIKDWFFQTGVYAGDAGPQIASNHGFDWRTGGSAGIAWFGETGYAYEVAGSGVIKLGGYYATGDFSNFSTSQTERGTGAFYGIIDHRFLDPKDNSFGLSVFGRASLAPEESLVTVYVYVDGGVKLDSLIFEDDAFGVAFSNTWFGNDYVSNSRRAGTPVSDTETIVEVTYQVPLSNWAAIQPDFQWVIDPHFSQRNAVVIGIRATIDL